MHEAKKESFSQEETLPRRTWKTPRAALASGERMEARVARTDLQLGRAGGRAGANWRAARSSNARLTGVAVLHKQEAHCAAKEHWLDWTNSTLRLRINYATPPPCERTHLARVRASSSPLFISATAAACAAQRTCGRPVSRRAA